jgi:hypothetical protein
MRVPCRAAAARGNPHHWRGRGGREAALRCAERTGAPRHRLGPDGAGGRGNNASICQCIPSGLGPTCAPPLGPATKVTGGAGCVCVGGGGAAARQPEALARRAGHLCGLGGRLRCRGPAGAVPRARGRQHDGLEPGRAAGARAVFSHGPVAVTLWGDRCRVEHTGAGGRYWDRQMQNRREISVSSYHDQS